MTFKLNLKIDQGSDYSKLGTWRAGVTDVSEGTLVDLTGCTARMQVRARIADPVVLLSLTTENGGVVLGGAAGTIEIVVPAAQSEAFTWTTGVYDLELVYPDGKIKRAMKGSVTVTPEVTRG